MESVGFGFVSGCQTVPAPEWGPDAVEHAAGQMDHKPSAGRSARIGRTGLHTQLSVVVKLKAVVGQAASQELGEERLASLQLPEVDFESVAVLVVEKLLVLLESLREAGFLSRDPHDLPLQVLDRHSVPCFRIEQQHGQQHGFQASQQPPVAP